MAGDLIDLAAWQLKILDRVLDWAAAVGFFACATSIWLSWISGLWSLVVLDLCCYGLIVAVALAKSLPYQLRAATLVGMVLLVGAGVLAIVGPFGVGLCWLLAVPCLSAVLFDARGFWIAELALGIALLAVAGLVSAGVLWWDLPVIPAWWPMALTSLLALSLMIGLSISTLMSGLQWSLQQASQRAQELEQQIEHRRRTETERAALEQQLILAQKMEGVGQMAGGIAHDFNNVLTVVQLEAAMARDTVDPGGETAEALDRLLQATRTAASLSSKLLLFSRRRALGKKRVAVDAEVRAFQPLLARLVGETVVLELDLHAMNAQVLAEPIQLEQLLTNLAANARDAMPSGGRLRISTVVTVGDDGPGLRLEVADDGIGMDAATVARVFDPFFTTKSEGVGTGLGLTTVYAIVRTLGGTIEVESAPGAGTRFRLVLPVDRTGEVNVAPEKPPTWRFPPAAARVVVVDDQEAVRTTVERALVQLGCRVWTAGSAADALALVGGMIEPPNLVLTDVAMPVTNGVELAERLRERYTVPIVAMSGYISDDALVERLVRIGVPTLRKPFTPDELVRAVGESLADSVETRAG